MRTISLTVLFVVFATASFAGSIALPSLKNLWDTAEVVISSSHVDIRKDSNQDDLPEDWERDYERVKIKFAVDEVVKGALQESEDSIWIEFFTAKRKEIPVKPEVLNPFPSHPFLKHLESGESYLVFLRRNVFGTLEPVHKSCFLSVVSKGYEM